MRRLRIGLRPGLGNVLGKSSPLRRRLRTGQTDQSVPGRYGVAAGQRPQRFQGRFDAFLITFNPGPGFSYFPSVPEIMITFGVVAFELMAYLVMVKLLPVLHSEQHA